MISTRSEMQALQRAAELEQPLQQLESRLSDLGAALHGQDTAAVDQAAAELHAALAAAISQFSRAARDGGVPPPLRRRLAHAGGQVAAQREALARASVSLDRAIDVLIPRASPVSLYSQGGNAERGTGSSGALLA